MVYTSGPLAIARGEDEQVAVEPVAAAGPLVDERFAGLEQEPDVAAPVVLADRRQSGLTGRHPGDGQGVARIALARPAGGTPAMAGQVGRHITDGQAGGHEHPGQGRPERRAALDPNRGTGGDPTGPGSQLGVPGSIVPELRSSTAVPSSSIAQATSVALWVSIPIALILLASDPPRYDGCGPVGQAVRSVQGHAPVRPRPARDLGRRGHLHKRPSRQPDSEPPAVVDRTFPWAEGFANVTHA